MHLVNSGQLLDYANIRREYIRDVLRFKNLPNNPTDLFRYWINQAIKAGLPDPNTMVISTVDQYGQPYQRAVLLKYFDYQSMVFYTNLGSRKAKHLEINPQVSLHFIWNSFERQVMILGRAEKLSRTDVINYFNNRPRNSQLSVWASHQSKYISARSILEDNFLKFRKLFKNDNVPLPFFWGGYRIKTQLFEFWQGNSYRLHDRFVYQKHRKKWYINRLAP